MLRAVLLCALVALATGLSCPECGQFDCPPVSEQDCQPWGVTVDVCGCCQVCARGLGDLCGGAYAGNPQCGAGLECVKPPLRTGELPHNQDGTCVWKDLAERNSADAAPAQIDE